MTLDPKGLERAKKAARWEEDIPGMAEKRIAHISGTLVADIITAYLTPEPEIEVTEEMLNAGHIAYCEAQQFHAKAKSWERSSWQDKCRAASYRAMLKVDPYRKPTCEHVWENGYWWPSPRKGTNARRCTKCGHMELL